VGVIGRRDQLQRIEEMVDAARLGRAGALVVAGEAGIGKTSLLDEVEASAAGFLRLHASGVESESTLGHAGLLQLLGPVRQHLDGIPGPQRRALEAAVGWGEPGAGDDRYLVAAATLSLLARAAEESPVLVVVDDFHWLDPESAAAVLFAARRLAHDPVAFLLATRSGSPAGTSLDGFETLALTGLTAADSADLFPPGTAPLVIERLVTAMHGNPLAMIEIAKQLSRSVEARRSSSIHFRPECACRRCTNRHWRACPRTAAELFCSSRRRGTTRSTPCSRRCVPKVWILTTCSVTPNAEVCSSSSPGWCACVTR
jgi:hypothetical protein